MVLLSPVIVASAASTMLSLLNFVLAPMLEVEDEDACMDSFNSWFYPAGHNLVDAAVTPTLKVAFDVTYAGKRLSSSMGLCTTSPCESDLSTATLANTCDASCEAVSLNIAPEPELPLLLGASSPLRRLSTRSPRFSQALAGPLALSGCTERAGTEHQLRESQGSPRPSASVPGIQGSTESEAVVAGLCTHQLPSCLASKVAQRSRAVPPTTCGVPQPSMGMPALRHVVPCHTPSGAGQEGEEELVLGASASVKVLIGVWEARGSRIRDQVKREDADRKMRALRPCRSLPARLE